MSLPNHPSNHMLRFRKVLGTIFGLFLFEAGQGRQIYPASSFMCCLWTIVAFAHLLSLCQNPTNASKDNAREKAQVRKKRPSISRFVVKTSYPFRLVLPGYVVYSQQKLDSRHDEYDLVDHHL